jgi:uncharacterized glyoxalase superfamily protein PhnB
MKYKSIRPILWTDKWQETINFYCNVLGFICDERNEEWQWASLHKDEAEIMLAKQNEHMPFEKPVFTGSFYINTDNVDELWNNLKDKASVVYPIENFDWEMREFAIADNNGYIIQFGQPIKISD